MEAATVAAKPVARRRGDAVRDFLSRYGLILFLLVLPVYFGLRDIGAGRGLAPLGNLLVQGISNGAIWALINFAHGDNFMIGTFVSFTLYGTLGLGLGAGTPALVLGLVACLVVSMAACATTNVMIERVAYRPLRNAPKLAPLITAVGFSFILQNVGILWFGSSQFSVPDLIHSQHVLFSVAGVSIHNSDVLAVAVT